VQGCSQDIEGKDGTRNPKRHSDMHAGREV